MVDTRQHTNVYAIGDLFPLRLDGTVGICDITGDWYCCLIGINHNSGIEGNNTLHFQFPFDSNGKGLAFVDSKYMSMVVDVGFVVYPGTKSSNSGGWKNSYMFTAILPKFIECISEDLRNIIKLCVKYSDNTGGGLGSPANVSKYSSLIFLLAEYEVVGLNVNANRGESTYQRQYNYYGNGSRRIKYKHNLTSDVAYWWTSSPSGNVHDTFCSVMLDGSLNSSTVNYSKGTVPAFVIA